MCAEPIVRQSRSKRQPVDSMERIRHRRRGRKGARRELKEVRRGSYALPGFTCWTVTGVPAPAAAKLARPPLTNCKVTPAANSVRAMNADAIPAETIRQVENVLGAVALKLAIVVALELVPVWAARPAYVVPAAIVSRRYAAGR